MFRFLAFLPGLLCAAESPQFLTELHAWEAEMARPGAQAARDLPENVRRILALEPSEREEGDTAVLAACYRALKGDRVAAARAARGELLKRRFADVGLAYPPRGIFLRAFKHEMELELWACDDGPFRKVAAFPLTAPSGRPGPKRRQGDRQVPEGCYLIDVFNPKSRFHLSLRLNYPNESDRILSDRTRPGGEIYVHGAAVSAGCLPLGDAAIEEVYLATLDTRASGQREIPVHIFPARMSGEAWKDLTQRNPKCRAFWENLQPIYDAFERSHRVPRIAVESDGKYRVR